MPEETFSVILLTTSGDYLLESDDQLSYTEWGVHIDDPHIINDSGKAQEVQAESIFVPFTALENIQFGDFEQETDG